MGKLVTLQAFTAEVREETLDGRTYLVAPVVAAVNGVLNNEYLSAEEILAVAVEQWNDIPLPIAHPGTAEQPASARSVDVIEERVCGRFYNARYETDGDKTKLKGELWIDIEKALTIGANGEAVVNRLRGGQPLEVSTAYFRDVEEAPGVYEGTSYGTVAHNLRPDHLALLPAEIGACSWQDGCGAPRINSEEAGETEKEELPVEKENDMKQNDHATGILDRIKRILGVNTMNREEMVAKLIESGADEALLENTTDEQVAWMYEHREVEEQPVEAEPVAEPVAEQDPVEEPVEEPVAEPVAVNADTEIDGVKLGDVMRFYKSQKVAANAEREGLVSSLVANERCTVSKETIALLPTEALKELVANFSPGNYAGVGMPRTNATQEIPVPPKVVTAKRGE